MKRGESKSRSQRQLRIGEVIRHVLVQLIDRGEANDPGLDGVSITVTEVRVSPDLRNATAFVMPLGGTGSDEILESLNRAAPFSGGVSRPRSICAVCRRCPLNSMPLSTMRIISRLCCEARRFPPT